MKSRNSWKSVMRTLLVSAFLLSSFGAYTSDKGSDFPSDGLLIKLDSNKSDWFHKNQDQFGIRVERKLNTIDPDIYLAKITVERPLLEVINKLKASPAVRVVEPNYIVSIVRPSNERVLTKAEIKEMMTKNDLSIDLFDPSVPSDPMFAKLWGLKNLGNNSPRKGVVGADIDALRAWEITKGSRDIKIAVIDTGIDYTHQDLSANMWVNVAEKEGKTGIDDDNNGFIDDIYGYDFANRDGDPIDDHSHGTHCAGTIGAIHNNGLGVAGVMDRVTLMPVKFLTAGGSGSLEAAIQSIDYATMMNVDIMSNSWGGGGYSKLLEDAIIRAKDKGIVFVAAAGNDAADNDRSPHYPSNYPVENVISVAAHNIDDVLANFSCYGRNTVHVAAPGQDILSTVKGNGYGIYSGTSMATPHVSGIVGLLLSKEGRIDFASLRERIMATSVPSAAYKGKLISRGRVNAYNLLTDTRPPRSEPNPSDWVKYPLAVPFESTHPYKDNENFQKVFSIPGAKYVRVQIKKYDLESGYDFVRLVDKKGVETEKVSGAGENYVSDYIEGDSVTIRFTSDSSLTKWGFIIESIEYIP
ncbi:MAG: S8 family serine peptidase [Oligoflexia bacterium]|nr:S8 family serine peptidase [Oligoflexia bacterium]